ncbi:MAG: double-strand break repair helicase AddA, partial [Alphaproteobacteria bacterium]|nr:double-strand break repair helicase AddA [Alphaproteobacteria bacterium]
MVHAPNLQPESDASSNRDVDPNVLQRKASDPAACAWVSASAGTGKTKVLTDRVLRLLLPARDGTPGTAPHKILCLTFTKAAASEMSLRLNKRLSRWAVADEDALRADLERNLLGRAPTPRECEEARKLFARVLDVPGGLKIMTIHSFCQSVLGRFPLEAGVPPGSEVLDEELAAKLLQGALNRVLDRARAETGSPLHAALASVAGDQNEEQFRALLKNLTSERNQMKSALEKFWSPGGLHAALCEFFAVNQTDTADALVRAACDERAFAASDLRRACTALACGTQTDKTSALMLQVWLDCAGEDRVEFWKAHIANFIKKSDGLPRTHHFPTKSVKAAFPDCERILRAESDRLVSVLESCKAVRCAALTRDLFELGGEIVDAYQADKERRGVLDYDDLILKTLALLKGESMAGLGKSAAWVLYKLDQGLDHILIDEAQDTNPEQWRIVEALCDEFFAGAGARDDRARTLFTVGDVKQSIYSFQRAAPEEFERMRADLRRKAEQAGRRWENVPLNIS